MATLYVTEYPETGIQAGTGVPVAFAPASGPVAEQTIAIGVGSVAGSAFSTKTKVIRIHTDAICSIKFGPAATVTAAATDPRMAANQTEYYAVQQPPGGTLTVAVIVNT